MEEFDEKYNLKQINRIVSTLHCICDSYISKLHVKTSL